MTFVIGSLQLTITRLQPETRQGWLEREQDWQRLEREIAAVRQEAYRQAALHAYGIKCQ
jgi:hypothetical protein